MKWKRGVHLPTSQKSQKAKWARTAIDKLGDDRVPQPLVV